MEISGKTSIIDSDFRAGAIFYSLTNLLLFSFTITSTVLWSQMTQKHSKIDGVNPLIMAVISGIVCVISAALTVYSIYKLLIVKEMRDKITTDLNQTVPEEERVLNIKEPEFKSLRDITKGQSSEMPRFSKNALRRNPVQTASLVGGRNFF